jgi:hypothetical protein
MRYRAGMAARTPRRSFATPFVITLAAVPACYVQPSAPPPQPQAEPAQPPDSHPVVVTNPPRPQPEPATPPPQDPPNPSVIHNPPRPQPAQPRSWHVYKTTTGCEAIVNVQCPEGIACNPPPPQKYDCPGGIMTDKPLTVVTTADGSCVVEREPPKCPPHAMCNPPRPQSVTCPK